MVRAPCCEKMGLKKGPWSPQEDQILINFIRLNGHSNWRALPKKAGLLRCGKSCRLRWTNYLRPDIKRGDFSHEEEETIIQLHELLGNRWSTIAARLPGRTDNEIKNIWHTHLKKRLNQNQASKEIKLNNDVEFGNQQPSSSIHSSSDHMKSESLEFRSLSPFSIEISSVHTESIDNCNNNNNVDHAMFTELAFSDYFINNLWSEEDFFENNWHLEGSFETINGAEPPQDAQFPVSTESISSCSSDTHDIMDFWSNIFMKDGELPEFQEI